LRTAAIALVLLRHTLRFFQPDMAPEASVDDRLWQPVAHFMANGWVGVDLFFLLSGFLITQYFLNRKKVDIYDFYQRRIRRIFPAYFVVLLLVVVGFFPLYQLRTDNLQQDILINALFMQDYLGSRLNVVFWSLGVEAKFYLLSPLLLIPLAKYVREKKWWHCYALVFAVIFTAPILRYYTMQGMDTASYVEYFVMFRAPFHACVDGLFFGVLLAVAMKHMPALQKKTAFTGLLLSLGGIVLLLTTCDLLAHINWFDMVMQTTLLSMLFFFLALFGLHYWAHKSTWKVFNWTAKISYSVYLVHWPLIPACLALPAFLGMAAPHNNVLSAAVFAIGLWGFSILIAGLLYQFVEKPFLRKRLR
jgi:peptidoglycan/LPS O-acetylase OafA/YrhL